MNVVIASTGVANLASVHALCARAGIIPVVTENPEEIFNAEYAILPGVGAFAPAARRLRERGIGEAFRARFASSKFTMGICLGMQLMCESSEESADMEVSGKMTTTNVAVAARSCEALASAEASQDREERGIGLVPGRIGKFAPGLPLPQLGWNRVIPIPGSEGQAKNGFLEAGWAYFANSYRLADIPSGFGGARAVYGESFVAALTYPENLSDGPPKLLLCQFHPELSGLYGLDLFKRWLGIESSTSGKSSESGDEQGRNGQ
jgi:glutamine amidotransferase